MTAPFVPPRGERAVLDDLVKLAAEIVTKPATRHGHHRRVAAIAEEIAAAMARPSDSERYVDDEAAMLVQALGHLTAATGGVADPLYVKWAKIAGVVLPDVHAAAARAFEQGRAP